MEETGVLGELQKPYKLCRADSGAISFEMIYTRILNARREPTIVLISKECPHEELYWIKINYHYGNIFLKSGEEEKNIQIPEVLIPLKNREFYLTWYNSKICMGLKNEPPFLEHTNISKAKNIGFIKLEVSNSIDWVIKCPPFPIKPLQLKYVNGGVLNWVKMFDNQLPRDALIGGYENEPIYIIRARHRGSLCPGKFVPSKQCAYIPWGYAEHKKKDFEVLCGFNVIWIKCKKNFVPENAFVAGMSEVNGENLYIGRARIGSDLVVGKVHMLYNTCYLPYQGKEVESYNYEILVRGDLIEHGVTANNKCYMNPMKALQPCF